MGVVQRQGLKRSILTFLGVGIGTLSTLFIYPLELEVFGTVQFRVSTGAFFAAFASLGVNALPVRYFPIFEDKESHHHGFLGFLLFASISAMVLFGVFILSFRTLLYQILDWAGFDRVLFEENMTFIALICCASVLTVSLEIYTSNFKRVAIPSIFTNLLIKIGQPVLILLVLYGWIGITGLKWLLVFLFFSIIVALAAYLYKLGEWSLRLEPTFLRKTLLKDMGSYALFGLLSSIGALLAFRVDTVMVASMTGTLNNGIYSIASFIVNVIEVPFNAVIVILTPMIASALIRQDQNELEKYSQNGGLNLMIIGLFFFIGIVTCMEDLFKLTPRYAELSKGKEVIWFLGTAKVFSMSLGINNYILNMSRYYKLSMLTFLAMALTNVSLNYVCIPKFQIAGAAMATSFSLIIFSLLTTYLVWIKLGIRPVSGRALIVGMLAVPSLLLGQILPDFSYPIVHIIVKGLLVSVLFLVPVLGFQVSPDLNRFVLKYLNLFLHRSRNFFKY